MVSADAVMIGSNAAAPRVADRGDRNFSTLERNGLDLISFQSQPLNVNVTGRPWTEAEIQLLGTKPDADVGRLIGRPGKAVWAKRRALGIADPPSLVRPWTEEENKVVLSHSVGEAAKILNRSVMAVRIRRRKLMRTLSPENAPQLLSLEEVQRRTIVPQYDSKEQEERVRLVDGPYAPPLIAIGGWLQCELRGELQVGGYTNALIPWPVAVGHAKQLIVCGDLVRALKTESRLAVSFHFGISLALVSEYRSRLGIERLTAGSTRLFWRNIDLARTADARAKLSRHHEGRGDLMTPEAREKLRGIQRRPKSEAWKQRMAERWQRRLAVAGRPEKWTEEELKLIGTRPDREVARLLNRSLSAVKGKKFQLLREVRQPTDSPRMSEQVNSSA